MGNEAVGFPTGMAEGVFGGRVVTFCLEMGSKLSDCSAL